MGNKIIIRDDLQPGDIGYVTYLHGIVYSSEYGYDHTFDGYVAEGMGKFAKSYDPSKERLWVAEKDGKIVGSIAIVKHSEAEAQLRWFLIDPSCRGMGLGKKLLNRAVEFCRKKQYDKIFLWTVKGLDAAIHLYELEGFEKTEENTSELWGQTITEERYDMNLFCNEK